MNFNYKRKFLTSYNVQIVLYAVIFISVSIFASGQKNFKKGFIITSSYDTINGFISLKSNYNNSRVCEFLKNDDENSIKYTPQDILGYRIENIKFYTSKDVVLNNQKKKVFLEFLLDGIVDLYYLKESNSEYFFIEKDSTLYQLSNDEIEFIDNNGIKYIYNSDQYKRALTILFQESPELSHKIFKTGFNYGSLIEITKEYHNRVCDEYKCIEYAKLNKSTIYLEPNIGIIYSWMGLGSSTNYAYNRKPYIGFNIRFTPIKINQSWNFITGITYSFNDFRKDLNNVIYNDTERSFQIYMEYSILRLPIIVEYSFPTGKLQPFLSIGYNNIFILNPDYEARVINSYSGVLSEPLHTDFRKYQLGFSSSLGLKYYFNNMNYTYFKGDFEYRMPSANLNHILDYHYVNSLILSFGYGIKIK